MMKNIRFHALNLDVPILDRYYYFDNGYVEDLEEHLKFLEFKHHIQAERDTTNKISLGHTFPLMLDSGRFVYIYYLRQADNWSDIHTRAHEETHAADNLQVLPYIQNAMKSRGFNINLFDYDDETRACIGSWYALVAWGQELLPHGAVSRVDARAYDILKGSRKKNAFEYYLRRLNNFMQRLRGR